jgi:uncharacterized iron-regulated membrane protein
MKSALRKFTRWAHLWLGLITGIFICLMGVTGGLVGLRPQIATMLSPAPAAVASCEASLDWNRAAKEITGYAHAEINRVYGPYDAPYSKDPRYHFRMATENPIIFQHVIYDACAGRVLGSINFGWMDWTVDLHHNLLSGRTGRRWAGAIGIAMLVSGLSGLLIWLVTKPSLGTAFRIQLRFSRRTARETHRAVGLAAALLLTLEAFTGLWLTFPQTMRSVLPAVPEDVRPARGTPGVGVSGSAGLGEWMAAAKAAIPDGFVREIRLPEGNGNVQIRMWRPGDFRILGNNVVYVASGSAGVQGVDRYSERSGTSRFVQAMAALHYDEWGGVPFRILSALAGFVTPVLFLSGILIWWYSRPRKKLPMARPTAARETAALTR